MIPRPSFSISYLILNQLQLHLNFRYFEALDIPKERKGKERLYLFSFNYVLQSWYILDGDLLDCALLV